MKRISLVLAILLVAAGCSSTPEVTPVTSTSPAGQRPTVSVSGAFVQLQEGGDPYVVMTVAASQPDVLTEVTGTDLGEVTLTAPAAQPAPSAPVKDAPLFTGGEVIDQVDLPGGQPATFGFGGYGLFLPSLKAKEGESVALQLVFRDAGTVPVMAMVRRGSKSGS